MAKFWVSSHKRWSKRTYWLLDWDRVFFRNNIACKDAEKRFRRQNSMLRWNSWADRSPGVIKQGHGSWRVGENGLNAMTPELPTLIVSFFVGTIPRLKLKSKCPVKLKKYCHTASLRFWIKLFFLCKRSILLNMFVENCVLSHDSLVRAGNVWAMNLIIEGAGK